MNGIDAVLLCCANDLGDVQVSCRRLETYDVSCVVGVSDIAVGVRGIGLDVKLPSGGDDAGRYLAS